MRHTEIRQPLTSTVEPPEDQAVRAAQVVLAVSESQVVRGAGGVGGVGKAGGAGGPGGAGGVGKPGGPGGAGGAGKPGVRAAQVVLESPVVRVAPENPVVQVGPQPEQKLAVAEPAPSRPRSPAEAVALTVSAVINPQRAGAAAAGRFRRRKRVICQSGQQSRWQQHGRWGWRRSWRRRRRPKGGGGKKGGGGGRGR